MGALSRTHGVPWVSWCDVCARITPVSVFGLTGFLLVRESRVFSASWWAGFQGLERGGGCTPR